MDLTCKRCLVRDMGEADMAKRIENTISSIALEKRCEQKAYLGRLSLCSECSRLISGICRCCGCFVEVRAAYAAQHCPDIPGKW